MAVSTITEWSAILNEGVVGASATMPTVAAGSDRLVLLACVMYNGGGNSQTPAQLTCNGIARDRFAGDSVARNRAAMSLYLFTESEIATISGQTITSTGSGSQKSIFYKLIGGAAQSGHTSNNAYSEVDATLTLSLARVADSRTELLGFTSSASTSLTMTNPIRTNHVSLTSGRRMSYGSAADSAGTSDSTVTRSNTTTALVVNFSPAPAQSISGITPDPLLVGSTGNTASLTGFTAAPTTATFGGITQSITASSASSVTFDRPAFVDGSTILNPTVSQDFVVSNSVPESATLSHSSDVPAGSDSVVVASAPSDDPNRVGYYITLTDGDLLIYPTESGDFELFADGAVSAMTTGLRVCWHWKESNGLLTQLNLTVNDAGEIISGSTGLTSRGLTVSGLTVRGMTNTGLTAAASVAIGFPYTFPFLLS